MKRFGAIALMCLGLFLYGCGSDDTPSAVTGTGGTGGTGGTVEPISSIYAFQTDLTYSQPNLKPQAGNFNTICSNAFSTHSPSVSCTNFYPFLGKTSTNGFRNFISVNGLSATSVVKLVDGTTTIASSLQNLIDSGPMIIGSSTWVGWPDSSWYSGVASDGSAGNNCQDYADDTSSSSVSIGTNGSSFDWAYRAPVCDYYDDYRFICLCN